MGWLTYASEVKKTPSITRAVELIEPYFDGEPSEVTSGLRTINDQMKIIITKLIRHRLDTEYPEFKLHLGSSADFKVPVNDDILYWWQRSWSKLLNIGDIVNPPIPAACLFDYVRPGSQENRKGKVIQESPHAHGLAFDIGGGKSLLEKSKRVMKAIQDKECFIKSTLIETVNNAIHLDVIKFGDI